ncbi:M24 family metallopeptidase [Gillisia sp. CAL575]|uniref:M24 family metallopeptidase n=1 Tax=Gillisia sp. CAL575 TaxID=985255 RepID=UPI0003A7AF1F|nr:Xaa-Pro peptidase family protein [Gillisia sp. CAL575]
MNKNGIGGSSVEKELQKLKPLHGAPEPIVENEFKGRLQKLCGLMKQESVEMIYINAGPNLYYFTGTKWSPSERLVGAILFPDETLIYVVPEFEIGTVLEYMGIQGEILPWKEHENVFQVISDKIAIKKDFKLAIDDTAAFRISSGFTQFLKNAKQVSAEHLFMQCRMYKSSVEIENIQYAMNITMEVQKATARIMRVGISSAEVVTFIDKAHRIMGADKGSYFCIVLFGKDTSFPHGVKNPKNLEDGDIILVDTGCEFNGYISDITRCYFLGTPTKKQQNIWEIERDAQFAAFSAIQENKACGMIDDETRKLLEKNDLGPGYQLPGLPHRVGHGIGIEIHEHPFIVKDNPIKLKAGMCFSIEPMICVKDEFGVRLEDHVYLGEDGPVWFTEPAMDIEDPFGYSK